MEEGEGRRGWLPSRFEIVRFVRHEDLLRDGVSAPARQSKSGSKPKTKERSCRREQPPVVLNGENNFFLNAGHDMVVNIQQPAPSRRKNMKKR